MFRNRDLLLRGGEAKRVGALRRGINADGALREGELRDVAPVGERQLSELHECVLGDPGGAAVLELNLSATVVRSNGHALRDGHVRSGGFPIRAPGVRDLDVTGDQAQAHNAGVAKAGGLHGPGNTHASKNCKTEEWKANTRAAHNAPPFGALPEAESATRPGLPRRTANMLAL